MGAGGRRPRWRPATASSPRRTTTGPDVAPLDVDLPVVDGLTAAGVSGFLVKDGLAEVLVDAVRGVARGEWVFPTGC